MERTHGMTDQPRRRALIHGLWVLFESRNPKLSTVRWHARFKQRYRTKADAQAAKETWETKGKILGPGDFEKPKSKPKVPVVRRYAFTSAQQELRVSRAEQN